MDEQPGYYYTSNTCIACLYSVFPIHSTVVVAVLVIFVLSTYMQQSVAFFVRRTQSKHHMSKDNDDDSTAAVAAIDVTGPKCSGIFGLKSVNEL